MRPSATSMSSVSPFPTWCGGENGFAVRADDGEAQPQDTLRGASGDQFGRIAEPGRLACEEIPGTGREGFAHLLQGHFPLSEQPLGMEEQVAGQLLKPQFLCPRGDQYVVAQLQGGVVEPMRRFVSIRSTSHPATCRRGFERRMRHLSATLVSLSWPIPSAPAAGTAPRGCRAGRH